MGSNQKEGALTVLTESFVDQTAVMTRGLAYQRVPYLHYDYPSDGTHVKPSKL